MKSSGLSSPVTHSVLFPGYHSHLHFVSHRVVTLHMYYGPFLLLDVTFSCACMCIRSVWESSSVYDDRACRGIN